MTYQNEIAAKLDLVARCFAVAFAFFLPLSTTFSDICFISAVFFSVIAGPLRQKFAMIKQTPVCYLFLGLFLLLFIGTFYSRLAFTEAFDFFSKYDKLLFAVLLLPLFAEEKWRKYAIYAFLVAMIVTLLLSYSKYFGWTNYKEKFQDSSSVFRNHIEQNFLMAFACYFLALQWTVQQRFRWVTVILLILALVNTLFINEGRSGYLLVVILMALFVWQTLRWRGLFVGTIAILILLFGAYFSSSTFQARVQSLGSDWSQYMQGHLWTTSLGQRVSYDKASLEIIRQHPVIGIGTGSFSDEFHRLNPLATVASDNPHNEYFNIATQLGFVGLLLLLAMFATIFYDSKNLPLYYRRLVRAVTLAIMIGSLFNSWIMDTTEGHFFVYFVMVCFGARRSAKITD
jgi:O-antigen ligase